MADAGFDLCNGTRVSKSKSGKTVEKQEIRVLLIPDWTCLKQFKAPGKCRWSWSDKLQQWRLPCCTIQLFTHTWHWPFLCSWIAYWWCSDTQTGQIVPDSSPPLIWTDRCVRCCRHVDGQECSPPWTWPGWYTWQGSRWRAWMWQENIAHSVTHLRRVEWVSATELEEELELLALIQGSRSTLHVNKPPRQKTQARRAQGWLNTLITPLSLCIKQLHSSSCVCVNHTEIKTFPYLIHTLHKMNKEHLLCYSILNTSFIQCHSRRRIALQSQQFFL